MNVKNEFVLSRRDFPSAPVAPPGSPRVYPKVLSVWHSEYSALSFSSRPVISSYHIGNCGIIK